MHQSGRHHIGWRESSSSRLSPFSNCSRRDVLPFWRQKKPNDKGIRKRRQRKMPRAETVGQRSFRSCNVPGKMDVSSRSEAPRLETCCCAKQSSEFADASAVKRCKRWKAGRPDSSSGYEFVVGVSAGRLSSASAICGKRLLKF